MSSPSTNSTSGCSRKYSSWHNNRIYAPISTLRYFETIVDEIDRQKISDEYWDYLACRIHRIEKLWADTYNDRTQNDAAQPETMTEEAPSETAVL